MPQAAPLVLGSSVTIARGQEVRVSSINIAPRITVPYEVSSIRFLAYPTLNATGEPGISPDSSLRGFLKWQFILGTIPLTDHFIPMWCLSPTRQLVTELGGYFEWRFKRPLLISPAGRIDARVQLAANTPNVGGSPTISVFIAYAGRLRLDLDKMPAMIDVPFCSAWDTTQTGGNLANDWTALRNPLAKPIDVDSIIARVENDETGLNGDDSTTLQIFDPAGRTLTRAGTSQIHAMFPTNTREFPYEGRIPENGHLAVRLTSVPSVTYRPMISYLGSRRERSL